MKRFILSLVCVLALVTEVVYADSEKIQNPGNGHYYQRIDIHMWWKEAKTYCEDLGGYLATITSQEENQFVYDNLVAFSPSDACWLGGTDENIEGGWQWITGEPWDYTDWSPGEPNSCGGDEDYLWMWGDGQWNDNANNASYCDGSPDYFVVYPICEWDIADVYGCIYLKGSPLEEGTKVILKQKGEGRKETSTDANGCYEFNNVVSGKKGRVIIRLPAGSSGNLNYY